MHGPKHPEPLTLPRRTVLKAAGLGAGAGLLSGMATPALAANIWSAEYWAKKSDKNGDVKLNLWRKRVGAPKRGEAALPVVFLVHGSSNSARSSYDLSVPGQGHGTSSGGIRAAAYAQAQPERRRTAHALHLHLQGPRRGRDRAAALIADAMKFGDQVPSGTYIDMAANLPIVDPRKILSPVLMLRGAFDGNSTDEDLLDFYRQLPNGDRQFVILPQTAHSAGYSKNRHLLYCALRNFLAAPAPLAV